MNQILINEPSYNPNEEDLKTNRFTMIADDLESKNNAVSISFVPLSNARHLRDTLLYTGDNSVVNVAKQVKDYVKGAFGADSNLHRQIRGLKFERTRRLR